jgi:hypothetical protein
MLIRINRLPYLNELEYIVKKGNVPANMIDWQAPPRYTRITQARQEYGDAARGYSDIALMSKS